MQSQTDDNFLSSIESELEQMLRGSDLADLDSLENPAEAPDFDDLESEFAELSEFMSDSDKTRPKNSHISALIEILEKAQKLVTALRGKSESEQSNDSSINTQLEQISFAVDQAHNLLKRLDKQVEALKKTVNAHQT